VLVTALFAEIDKNTTTSAFTIPTVTGSSVEVPATITNLAAVPPDPPPPPPRHADSPRNPSWVGYVILGLLFLLLLFIAL
jgi:hypothetical protein